MSKCTKCNVENICLNISLVIQISSTQKEVAKAHVELKQVFKVPAISL
jgi:hypothetical protein